MSRRGIVRGIAAAALIAGLTAGCGNDHAAQPKSDPKTVVYVSNADSAQISVLGLDNATGALEPVQTVPVSGTVMPMTIGRDRRYLYASLRSAPYSVARLAIAPGTGRLDPVSTTPLPDNSAYLSTDHTGRYLFAASYSGDKISVNAIAPDGGVSPAPIQVIATPPHAHSIVVDPSNRYVFASILGGDVILQFRFDAATGRLTPNEVPSVATKPGAGPRHLVFAPNGRFAYGTNELDGTVNTYRFDSGNGTLTLIGSNPGVPSGFSGKPWTSDLHMTPDGRFLYIAERTSSTIGTFRVDGETGALTRTATTPTETQPRGFGIDPRGRYLVAAGEKSAGISIYAIDRDTGALTARGHRDVGRDPNWVEILDLP